MANEKYRYGLPKNCIPVEFLLELLYSACNELFVLDLQINSVVGNFY